jgi:hypothetical protein
VFFLALIPLSLSRDGQIAHPGYNGLMAGGTHRSQTIGSADLLFV